MDDYLIEGLIPRRGLTIVNGHPGSGKTFWTIDIAMHIAMGQAYRGRSVRQGTVAYLVFEGALGMSRRLRAYRIRHQCGGDVPFFLAAPIRKVDDDLNGAYISNAIGLVRVSAPHSSLVVMDAPKLPAATVANIIASSGLSGCAIIIVQHTPKSQATAGDQGITISRDGNMVTAQTRNGVDIIQSRLENVKLGIDEDGDDIVSCVAVAA